MRVKLELLHLDIQVRATVSKFYSYNLELFLCNFTVDGLVLIEVVVRLFKAYISRLMFPLVGSELLHSFWKQDIL